MMESQNDDHVPRAPLPSTRHPSYTPPVPAPISLGFLANSSNNNKDNSNNNNNARQHCILLFVRIILKSIEIYPCPATLHSGLNCWICLYYFKFLCLRLGYVL